LNPEGKSKVIMGPGCKKTAKSEKQEAADLSKARLRDREREKR